MTVQYVEIVTENPESVIAMFTTAHGLSFGEEDADMGYARVATKRDGTWIGVRKPLAAHDAPIIRTYHAVEDIDAAVKKAEKTGAQTAYGPVRQGQWGSFAIQFQGGLQHGLWQR